MEFHPTINEEKLIGGSQTFGSRFFTPDLTGVTGTYTLSGVYQRMGRILFWAVDITGTSTTTSTIFTPPITPQKINPAAVLEASLMAYQAPFFDEDGVYIMNTNGTCSIPDKTVTDGVRRLSGWYWIK